MKLAAVLSIALATLVTSEKPDGAIGFDHETNGGPMTKPFWLFDSSFENYGCLHFEPNGVATQNLDPDYRCRYYGGGDCATGLVGPYEGIKGTSHNQTLLGRAHSATCWFAGQ